MANPRLAEQRTAPDRHVEPRRRATVALFGEALADIFPERRVWGGAPLNVARHLHAFGLPSLLITSLGLDTLGDELLHAIAASGMKTSGIQRTSGYPTGRVEVALGPGGHRFTILADQAYDHIDGKSARAALDAAQPQLLYFGSLAQRGQVSRTTLQGLLQEQAMVKFFDINLRSPWYERATLEHSLDCADILKLNHHELELIAKSFGLPERHPESRLTALMHRFRLSSIILTRGEDGAWLLTDNGTLHRAERSNFTATVVDTVGAGDAFSAVCILGLIRGWPFPKILEKANAFASAICGIRGALPVDPEFYQRHRDTWTP